MRKQATAAATAKAAEKERLARESAKLEVEAVAASVKLRERFDAERAALARRYGVLRGLN